LTSVAVFTDVAGLRKRVVTLFWLRNGVGFFGLSLSLVERFLRNSGFVRIESDAYFLFCGLRMGLDKPKPLIDSS
jgi:hypothetical protein